MNNRALAPLALLIALSAPSVHAQEPKEAVSLPGVDGAYSIVAPAPEPDELPADATGTKRVGNWELTVSGYVWVQVGASSARGN